ncbi:hypothetical protein VBD025_16605 [Virgibacillus flavescens]|uniref:hypothetical protein n=1 Tax=Virgibacillus flavescens TaxID=1611422 RepID=UPI003D359843
MNWNVLKDVKSMLGFIISFILGAIAILAASFDNEYWVVFSIAAMFFTTVSVIRAGKLTG